MNKKDRSCTGSNRSSNKHFEKWTEKLDMDLTVEVLEKPCLLGTSRIIWKVLDMK